MADLLALKGLFCPFSEAIEEITAQKKTKKVFSPESKMKKEKKLAKDKFTSIKMSLQL